MKTIHPETKPLNPRSRAAHLSSIYAKFQATQNAETSQRPMKANVVIIDSDNVARESLKQFLEIEGYAVHTYRSVADFENNSSLKEYDVILIDVNFSDENLLFWLKNQKLISPTLLSVVKCQRVRYSL
jgi:PleD family two-component response regulator